MYASVISENWDLSVHSDTHQTVVLCVCFITLYNTGLLPYMVYVDIVEAPNNGHWEPLSRLPLLAAHMVVCVCVVINLIHQGGDQVSGTFPCL